MEYRRNAAGVCPFLSGPCAITPKDMPSRYGNFPPWSKVTCTVSQLASPVSDVIVCGYLSFLTTFAVRGVLGLNKLKGTSLPSTILTPFFFGGAAAVERTCAFRMTA